MFFEPLNDIDSALYLIFFVLAGAHLKIGVFFGSVWLVAGFIFFRALGKILGVFSVGAIIRLSRPVKNYMGFALLPQAGVAIGCAIIAGYTLGGEWGDKIINVTIAATVIFELIGPWITKFSLTRAGEIKR